MNFAEENLILGYRFKSSPKLLIDVGGHHGSFSRLFAKRGWHVIAFEPEKKNRAVFRREMNAYENVICIPKAVSNESGRLVPFYTSEVHFGIHSLKPFHETHKLAYEVETITLEHALEELNVPSVSLLKIDIEGADFLALKGFDFEKYGPELIMIEFMDERSEANYGYTHHDVVKYMAEKGYAAFVSEWAPIKEYAREGVQGEPHTWLQCVPYPLDHEPAWGNLLFVPEEERNKFARTLVRYLHSLNEPAVTGIYRIIRKIPGVKTIQRVLTG